MFLLRQGGKTDYNFKEFYLDSADELSSIDTSTCCTGSAAYIIATGTLYLLNSNKEWIQQ